MRCHIKVKNKNLNTAQLKLLHLWSLISTYKYMNDDGRSPIIVTKSHLTPHNGRPVYVTSEKIKTAKITLIEHYPVIVYFDIDISYTKRFSWLIYEKIILQCILLDHLLACRSRKRGQSSERYNDSISVRSKVTELATLLT